MQGHSNIKYLKTLDGMRRKQ